MKGKTGLINLEKKILYKLNRDYTEKININIKYVKYIIDNNNLNKDNLRFDCEINVFVTFINRIKLWNS